VAGRAKYSDEDKSRAYVALATNDGKIKPTARDTGIPTSTLRMWRDEWEKNGPPQQELVQKAAMDFLGESEEVRNLALTKMKEKLEKGDGTLAQIATVFGVLDDKITRAKGLATSRTEHVHTLPSADEVRELMSGFVSGAIDAAKQRQEEIVDAELVEPKALPAASS